jgi:exosortase
MAPTNTVVDGSAEMNPASKSGVMNSRHACLLGLIVVAAVIFHGPLTVLIGSSISVEQYSQILVVAPISVLLLYMERKKIFAHVAYSLPGGVLYLALLGAFAYFARHASTMDPSNYMSLSVLLFAGCCLAAFVLCYGIQACRVAAFPLFFLVLMTPMPDWMRERTITFLQNGSAVVTDWFFTAARIPFRREGVVLALPAVTIEIAQECSGIRSSIVLFLVGLVLGHLYLKSGWSNLALALLMVPLTIVKNGLRIFTLSTLGMYVDPSFLTGRLHHHGGFVFFALAFVGLWFVIWVLQKVEGVVANVGHPAAGSA